jgi:hypothetical protein
MTIGGRTQMPKGVQTMPFYFRIPLPGPFGYSARIGGKRKRRKPVQRQPVRSTPMRADARETPTFTGRLGDWECDHHHTTARGAALCGLQRKLDEYSELEREQRAIDMTDTSPEVQRQYAEQGERIAEAKREVIREMDAL